MRFALYSVRGGNLWLHKRLVDEGHEVLVYIDKENGKNSQHVGDGIIPKTLNLGEWTQFARHAGTISLFDFTGKGELADRLRSAGCFVVGAGEFCDRLENDRPFGEAFAEAHGIQAPPSYRFSTLTQAIAFLKKDPKQKHGDGGWAWKPNQDLGADSTWIDDDTESMMRWLQLCALPKFGDNHTCLLQEKIKGVAVSTARWWNGRAWVGPYNGTIEEKKMMPGDVGPSTGCMLNLVWYYAGAPHIATELQFERLAATFRQKNAPPGIYDINAIVNRKGVWFLEWTPRFGYDSEATAQRGITNYAGFLSALVHGTSVDAFFDSNHVYAGVRLTLPPYPLSASDLKESLKPKLARTTPVLDGLDGLWDKFFVAEGLSKGPNGYVIDDASGHVGVAVSAGSSLKGCCDDLYAYLKDTLSIPNLSYRIDAEKIIEHDLDEMTALGWETTPVLEPDESGDDN